MTYTIKENLKPSGLQGISDAQINDHWGLYVAYVNQSNGLKKELDELREAGQGASMAYADRRRRLGFELNGMVMHEYYFEGLGNFNGDGDVETLAVADAIAKRYGSLTAWQEDFANTGKTRGIGWAVCAIDPATGDINNHFIQLHEDGNIAGFQPLIVMDVWEHAYMVDHKAGGRADYIKAFLANIDWAVVEKRYQNVTMVK